MFVGSVAPLIANSRSKSLLVNTLENARPTFDNVVTDRLQGMVDTNFFYKRVTDYSDFSTFFLDWLSIDSGRAWMSPELLHPGRRPIWILSIAGLCDAQP